MTFCLDHLVVGADTLAEGSRWMAERLGQPAQGGGAHPLMGTHNALWRMGSAYLEVISIDPAATTPPHARWYGLDDPDTRKRLEDGPALLTWVVASSDLTGDLSRLEHDPGPVLDQKRGDMHWKISVPRNGIPPGHGLIPTVIAWPDGQDTPPQRMADLGLRIKRLSVRTDDADIVRALATMELGHIVDIEGGSPMLSAEIDTPAGPLRL